jgi:Bacteriophage HK97-gp10, putative tail-component
MAFGVGIKFDLRDLTRQLEQRGKNVKREATRALRAGAKPVIADVQERLLALAAKPGWEHTGLTAQSIGVLSVGRKRGAPGVIRLKIGARPGYKTNRKTGERKTTRFRLVFTRRSGGKQYVFVPANVLHLLELGTRPHATGNKDQLFAGDRRLGVRGKQTGPMHPGSRPFPTLRPAVVAKQAEAVAIAAALMKKAIES